MFLPTGLDRLVSASAPDHDALQSEMAEIARQRGFPIIGRVAGAYLASVARARNAQEVFEFGSGFGYSATWFLKGMDETGHVILTEFDADNLSLADEFLSRAGDRDRVRLEHGNALDIVDRYDGPFDVVLIDHRKSTYPEAFERVIEKVPPGGVVIADNILDGPVWYEDILPFVVDETGDPEDADAAGLVEYLRTVKRHPESQSVVLPIGSGLAVTTRMQ